MMKSNEVVQRFRSAHRLWLERALTEHSHLRWEQLEEALKTIGAFMYVMGQDDEREHGNE